MIVCIDSQIIVWGIKEQATSGQEEMIGKAQSFFRWIDENGHDCIIPSIVVAEVLSPEPPEIRAAYLETLTQGFVVVNFDVRAGMKYAELLYGKFQQAKETATNLGVDKHTMKADHMIIATALANGANCIYSYDKAMKAFATGHIEVKEFPTMPPRQKSFWEEEETPF